MRFLGKRIDFHNLKRKVELFYDKNFLLALEKMQLRRDINSLPEERRKTIESRIAALENFDEDANFFKTSIENVRINGIMTSSQYFKFITDDELFEIVPIHIIAKLLMNNRDRDEYLSNVLMYKELFGKEFLEYIMSQDNPLEIIDDLRRAGDVAVKKHAKAYYEYLDEHPDVDKNILMRNLLYVCSKTAFFELSNKVLSGEELFDIEKCYRSYIENCNFSDRDGINPDYLFTYLYGLSYYNVDNLINKYGADLEYYKSADPRAISRIMELNPKNYQRIISLFPAISMIGISDDEIRNIDEKRLEELTKVHETFALLNEMKKIADSLKDPDRDEAKLIEYAKERAKTQSFISYIDLQKQIITLFENEFNRVLYNPVKDAVRLDDLSAKFGVDIYELDYEKLDKFYGLLREENIFHKDIKKTKDERYEVTGNTHYDGLATSPVNSINFKLVPHLVEDVIYGYTSINGIQNMAPWDFASFLAIQYELAPERESYNKNPPGIVFHMPNRLLEHARLGPTELTMYAYQVDEGKFRKVYPDYYFYEIGGKFDPNNPKSMEANIERFPEIKDNNILYKQWYMTKSEAKYFGKPILLVNTQKLINHYEEKVLEMREKLFSSNETREKIELMEKMILIFEGCSNSIKTTNTHKYSLESELFEDKNRDDFYNSIFSHIEETIQTNPEQGKELLLAYKSLCEKELAKITTIASCRGGAASMFTAIEDYNLDNYPLENGMIYQLDKIAMLEAKQFGGEYAIFKPSDTLKDLMKAIRQPIGKEEHYNVPGAIHGIEHADKVALFGDAIAQREGLSNRDRKIVDIACMLHDWKRVDNSRNNYHGRAGAELIVKEFKKGNLDFLGLTEEEIPMLATAVCYHNYVPPYKKRPLFKRHNRLDSDEIMAELKQFGVDKLNLSREQYNDYLLRTMKLCSIVRDADNLDRFRFSKRIVLERPTYAYLFTDAAKSPEMRAYANLVNQMYARMVLEKNHPSELLEEDENTDYVEVLEKVRAFINGRPGRNRGINYAEEHEIPIPIDELWDRLYSLSPRMKVVKPVQKDPVLDSAIEASKETVRTGKMRSLMDAFKDGISKLFNDDNQR